MDSPWSSGNTVATLIIILLSGAEYMVPSLSSSPVLDEILKRGFNGLNGDCGGWWWLNLRGCHGRI